MELAAHAFKISVARVHMSIFEQASTTHRHDPVAGALQAAHERAAEAVGHAW